MATHPSTPEQILEVIAEAMPTLRQMGALRLGIFGSRVHGVARIDSDVDVLVTLAPGRDLFFNVFTCFCRIGLGFGVWGDV